MKICVAQTRSEKGDIQQNLNNHKAWIEIAVSEQADLITFPELSLTGYEPTLANELATDQNDTRLDFLQHTSDQNNIAISVGLPTKSKSAIFISMVIFLPNHTRQTYSKQMLHTDELPYFSPGDQQVLLTIKGSRIALAICYESLREEHSKLTNTLGANVYLASVAKSLRGIKKASIHYPRIAAQYSMPVLMANSVGACDRFESVGGSAVWNSKGKLVGQLDDRNEGLLIYDIETEQLTKRTID